MAKMKKGQGPFRKGSVGNKKKGKGIANVDKLGGHLGKRTRQDRPPGERKHG